MGQIPSKYLEQAADALGTLPGIGKRTALRMALHLLDRDLQEVEQMANAIVSMRKNIGYCKICHNISDTEICSICSHPKRDHSTICIVESIRDVMAIENTNSYSGVYHVLGGIISPIDGIGPNDIAIVSLEERLQKESVSELIFALPATVEGDTTIYYIFKKIKHLGIKTSSIARGIAVGDHLEYADEVSLSRSIMQRLPYNDQMLL
ncbi:MAG: recombination mediator RecR [Bacteroidales bacterium]|nr:recombination mediator RecR [Bacteroidales bacterium]